MSKPFRSTRCTRLPLFSEMLLLLVAVPAVRAQQPPRTDDGWTSILGTNSNPFGPGGTAPFASVVASNGEAYVGMNDGTELQFGWWDGTAWTLLGGRLRASFGGTFLGEIAVDSQGRLYVAGYFNEAVNGDGSVVNVRNVARWNAVLSPPRWESLGEGTAGIAAAVVVDAADNVYVGGNFNEGIDPGGAAVPLHNVGRWNAAQGRWEALGGGVNEPVQALALDAAGNVIAAGRFTQTAPAATGGAPSGIARWNVATSSWEAFGNGFTSPPAVNPAFERVLADGSDLYVVGATLAGEWLEAHNADGSTVTASVLRWNGAQSRWEAFSAGLPGRSTGLSGLAYRLSQDGSGTLYVLYRDADDEPNRVAQFSPGAAQWEPIAAPSGDFFSTIAANPAVPGNFLYLGGQYTAVTNPASGVTAAADNHAWWDGVQWNPMQVAGGGTTGGVLATAVDRPFTARYVAVGGTFTQVAFVPAERVALFDGQRWQPLGGGVTAPVDAAVHTLAFGDPLGPSVVYAGGAFEQVTSTGGNTLTAGNIASYDIDAGTWGTLGQGVNGPVYALLPWKNRPSASGLSYLYVGGAFTQAVNGDGSVVNAGGVVRWNFSTGRWEALGGGVSGGAAVVHALAAGDGFPPHDPATPDEHDVFVGGAFTTATDPDAGAVTATNIARWSADHQTWHPVGQGTNDAVRALAYLRGRKSPLLEGDFPYAVLYAGGDFTAVRNGSGANVITNHLAKWFYHTDTWELLGRSFTENGTDGPVHTLRFHGWYTQPTWLSAAGLVVGGAFAQATGTTGAPVAANHIVILQDLFPLYTTSSLAYAQFFPLGPTAVDDVVYDAAVTHCPEQGLGETVYAGGDFQRAGRLPSPYLARWRYNVASTTHVVVVNASPRCTSGCGARAVTEPLPSCAPGLGKTAADFDLFGELGYLGTTTVADVPVGQPFDLVLFASDDPGTPIGQVDSVAVETAFPETLVLMGVDEPGRYAPNPDGLATGLYVLSLPLPALNADAPPNQAAVRFVHGVTDAPAVDVVVQGGEPMAEGVTYGAAGLPALVPAGPTTLEVRRASDGTLLGSFPADLPEGSATVVLTGFLDPAANQNGPPLTLTAFPAETPTAVEPGVDVAEAFTLSPAYPNPFTAETHVTLTVGETQHVTVTVYDLLGRRVARLHEGVLTAGRPHRFTLEGHGRPSGLYFCEVAGERFHASRTVLLVK